MNWWIVCQAANSMSQWPRIWQDFFQFHALLRKSFFCLSLNFLDIMLKKIDWDFLNIFLNFYFPIFFSSWCNYLILYVTLCTNNKRHFLSNENRIILNKRKSYKLLNFVTFKELQEKIRVLKNCNLDIWVWRCSQHFLRFLGFWDSFSYRNFSYEPKFVPAWYLVHGKNIYNIFTILKGRDVCRSLSNI